MPNLQCNSQTRVCQRKPSGNGVQAAVGRKCCCQGGAQQPVCSIFGITCVTIKVENHNKCPDYYTPGDASVLDKQSLGELNGEYLLPLCQPGASRCVAFESFCGRASYGRRSFRPVGNRIEDRWNLASTVAVQAFVDSFSYGFALGLQPYSRSCCNEFSPHFCDPDPINPGNSVGTPRHCVCRGDPTTVDIGGNVGSVKVQYPFGESTLNNIGSVIGFNYQVSHGGAGPPLTPQVFNIYGPLAGPDPCNRGNPNASFPNIWGTGGRVTVQFHTAASPPIGGVCPVPNNQNCNCQCRGDCSVLPCPKCAGCVYCPDGANTILNLDYSVDVDGKTISGNKDLFLQSGDDNQLSFTGNAQGPNGEQIELSAQLTCPDAWTVDVIVDGCRARGYILGGCGGFSGTIRDFNPGGPPARLLSSDQTQPRPTPLPPTGPPDSGNLPPGGAGPCAASGQVTGVVTVKGCDGPAPARVVLADGSTSGGTLVIESIEEIMRLAGPPIWGKLHREALSINLSGDLTSRRAAAAVLIEDVTRQLPCGECKQFWLTILAEHPPTDASVLVSNEAFFARTVFWHNLVNRKLGKREIDLDFARAIHTK